MSSAVPHRVGKYRIVNELGRGGMGVVYLAEDVNLHRQVAIKMVTPSERLSGEYLRRFRREAQAVAALSHPNVVHINAFEDIDGQFLIEMPLIPGGSLRDAIAKGITIGGFTCILGDALSALSACHEAGIVHRDVKPSNLLLTSAGRGMLTDFGVATLMDGEWQATLSGATSTFFFGGTPQYVCPGAINGEPPSPRHDLYSLGIVAHEVFLGESPFRGNSPLELLREISEGNLPSLGEAAPQLSPAFVSLVGRLVNGADSESARALLEALKDTPEWSLASDRKEDTVRFSSRSVPGTGLAPRSDPPEPAAGRRWRIAAIAFGVVAVALLLALARSFRVPDSVSGAQSTGDMERVSQEMAFRDGNPGAEKLLTLWRDDGVAPSRVLWGGGSAARGETFPVLLIPWEEGAYKAIGYTEDSLWGVDLVPAAPGAFEVRGTWATYETIGAPAFRWGKISGSSVWDGDANAPFWLTFEIESQSDPARWTNDIVLAAPPVEMTDTAFLAALERTSFALPIIYNELPARVQSNPWEFSALLPAVQDARLSAAPAPAGSAIELDGELREAFWRSGGPEHVYTGRPKSAGATLRAVHDNETVYLGVDAGELGPVWRLEVAFLERPGMPVDSMPWRKATIEESGAQFEEFRDGRLAPAKGAWEWGASRSGIELAIPLRHEVLLPSLGSRVVHVNVKLTVTDQDGRESARATWGWPEVDKAAHGTRVYLEESDQL